jgi:hypothetical protein
MRGEILIYTPDRCMRGEILIQMHEGTGRVGFLMDKGAEGWYADS